jgi:hypothetical protein
MANNFAIWNIFVMEGRLTILKKLMEGTFSCKLKCLWMYLTMNVLVEIKATDLVFTHNHFNHEVEETL